MQCSGTETRLVDCPLGAGRACSHNQDVGVRCYEQTGMSLSQEVTAVFTTAYNYSDCADGEIRLVGGHSSLDGRVEVCYSGVWGTVCSDFWGMEDANVVCRQLQNSTSGKSFGRELIITDPHKIVMNATARLNSAFGPGNGLIFLDDVMCNGQEDRLFDCPSRGLGVTNCGHHQDAGVECVSGNVCCSLYP